jgi:hypothetical protein
MASFDFSQNVSAPVDVVWEVLSDHRGYARITPLRAVELEREGEPAPNGVGAIRVLRMIGPAIREEVVEYEPNSRLVYKLISGAPVRDHVGTIVLTANGASTHMSYKVDTTPTVPVIGGLVAAISRQSVGQLVKGIVRESERRAKAAPASP